MTDKILGEHIAHKLRRDILRGRFPPGTVIKERDSAAELGVSRTPMREAIRMLANEGLVELRPARSPIVRELDVKEVSDQVEVLIALEKLSAELACHHASDQEIEDLAGIVRHMDAEFYNVDPLDMFEIDMSFHTAIAQASHNNALAETHRSYLQRLWHARHIAAVQRRNRERVISEHSQIIAALRQRDPKAARKAIDNHLWHLAQDIRDQINKPTESAHETHADT